MKFYTFKFLLFVLFSAILTLIAEGGLIVHKNKLHIVGRFNISYNDINSVLPNNIDAMVKVIILQAKVCYNQCKKPLLNVLKTYQVAVDKKGYFILKNMPDKYSYVLIGAQLGKKNFSMSKLIISQKRRNLERILNLGNYNLQLNSKRNNSIVLNIYNCNSNLNFFNYFSKKSFLNMVCCKLIDTSNFWRGKTDLIIKNKSDFIISEI